MTSKQDENLDPWAAFDQPALQNTLRSAVHDFSWLLSRAYSDTAALKLVGDRYNLDQRARLACMRASAADAAVHTRKQKHFCIEHFLAYLSSATELSTQPQLHFYLDGFNLLITVESWLAGHPIFVGRDGAWRDLASQHRAYRHGAGAHAALVEIGTGLHQWCMHTLLPALPASARAAFAYRVHWLFDTPVSGSGALCRLVDELAEQYQWPWVATTSNSPDHAIAKVFTEQKQRQSAHTNPDIFFDFPFLCAITSDSWILDQSASWINLVKLLVQEKNAPVRLIDLSAPPHFVVDGRS